MSQYIGKTISLISVTDNRYVGLLEEIDSEKGTVTLKEVRCFGTEGRKNWGPDEVYPNPTVYNQVKFNGNDVKDLNILDVNIQDVHPVMPPMPQQTQPPPMPQIPTPQPQPVTTPQSTVAAVAPAVAPVPAAAPHVARAAPVPAAVAGYGVYTPVANTNEERLPQVSAASTDQRTERDINQNQREQHNDKRNSNRRQPMDGSRKVVIPGEDFDFQSSNAKFAKDGKETTDDIAAFKEAAKEKTASPETFYDKKSSFFDTISTSAETNTNMRWQEEKALNLDTFGQASARPRNQRGDYRGGSRGGRRGYYQNNRHRRNNNYGKFQSDSSFNGQQQQQ